MSPAPPNGYTNGHERHSSSDEANNESLEARHGFPLVDAEELLDPYSYWTEVSRPSLKLYVSSQTDSDFMQIRPELGNIQWTPDSRPLPDWNGKSKYKTVQAALFICLRLGFEPPDIIKTDPCAKLEAWVDTTAVAKEKSLDQVGENLQKQYESLATSKIKYKLHLDPKVEETRRSLTALRRVAKTERILVHYNGHGVPRPTESGEIWLFDKDYTQYIPVTLSDILLHVEAPSIFVWDCSAAGNIVSKLEEASIETLASAIAPPPPIVPGQPPKVRPSPHVPWREVLQLGACASDQILPMNPDLPADLFTSCLTSPIEMALRFFILRNPLKSDYDLDLAFKIPGKLTDRKSPLGELYWIFTSVTDTIAWNSMPQATFQRLFRNDLTVGALFRGYLLAERIMRHYECTPCSVPALPPMHNHPLWDSWDLAVDRCLAQLPGILARETLRKQANEQGLPVPPETMFQPSRFFTDQLMAFEMWLEQGTARCAAPDLAIFSTDSPIPLVTDGTTRTHNAHPEQLPIVLQVLLSQAYRLRALKLLVSFLNLGSWAVHLSLSIGTFPYVLKLLQAPPAGDHRPYLIFIWTRILGVFPSCREDLIRPQPQPPNANRQGELPFHYFVRVLLPKANSAAVNIAEHQAMCAFVLAQLCRDFRPGQNAALAHSAAMPALAQHLEDEDPLLRQWSALALGQSWDNHAAAKGRALQEGIHSKLTEMVVDDIPEVRAAVIYALGTFLGANGSGDVKKPAGRSLCSISVEELNVVDTCDIELGIALSCLRALSDGSPMVRRQLVTLLSVVVGDHMGHMIIAAHQNSEEEKNRSSRRQASPTEDRFRIIDQKVRDAVESGEPPSNPAFKSVIFACIYKTLLDLASDPHPTVCDMACIVLDQIHAELFASPLTTSTDSAFADNQVPANNVSPHASVRGLNRSFSQATDLDTHVEDEVSRPPRRINSVGTALKSLAGLTFTEPTGSVASRQRGTRSQLPSPDSASPQIRQAKSAESLRDVSSSDEASVADMYAELLRKEEDRLEELRRRPSLAFPFSEDEEMQKSGFFFDKGPLPLRSDFFDYCARIFTEPQMKVCLPVNVNARLPTCRIANIGHIGTWQCGI